MYRICHPRHIFTLGNFSENHPVINPLAAGLDVEVAAQPLCKM
jgi:hypothetical protein